MKTLIYSFEKFHNLKSNPAYDVSKEITEKFNSKEVKLVQLPVTFDCWDILETELNSFKPDFILGIGVAMGGIRVRLEKIGLNYKHADILDNKGVKFTLEKINPKEKLAYETEVDVLKFSESLKSKGIPNEISFCAGTYICNYAYYNCLHYVNNKKIKTLFLHVPSSPKEAIELNLNISVFPTALIANALYEILKTM